MRSRGTAAGLAAATAVLIGCSSTPDPRSIEQPAVDIFPLVERGALLVDVRPVAERARDGVPEPALIAIYVSGEPNVFLRQVTALASGAKDRPVALICGGGIMSREAASLLARNGFTRGYSVSDGYGGGVSGPGWRRWGLPVRPGP